MSRLFLLSRTENACEQPHEELPHEQSLKFVRFCAEIERKFAAAADGVWTVQKNLQPKFLTNFGNVTCTVAASVECP